MISISCQNFVLRRISVVKDTTSKGYYRHGIMNLASTKKMDRQGDRSSYFYSQDLRHLEHVRDVLNAQRTEGNTYQ